MNGDENQLASESRTLECSAGLCHTQLALDARVGGLLFARLHLDDRGYISAPRPKKAAAPRMVRSGSRSQAAQGSVIFKMLRYQVIADDGLCSAPGGVLLWAGSVV